MDSLLNPNIKTIKPSATLFINQQVKRLRMEGHSIIHFGFGESPFPVPDSLCSALIQHSGEKSYLAGEGLLNLRQAVSDYYINQFDYRFTPQDIFITPGSKEAIYHLLYLLQGDLLLPKPSWVSYKPQATLLGKTVREITTTRENNYCLKAEDLKKLCYELDAASQKILILNSPNNPTGCIYEQSLFNQLAPICRDNNIIVISDEIYAGIQNKESSHASMMYCYPEKTIVTGGISKVFSAGGYRLGFCMIPNGLVSLQNAFSTLISETYSCVSSPIQYAAVKAYEQDKALAAYLEQCSALHCKARDYLYERFMQMNLCCPKPAGAFYLMPDFSNYRTQLKKKGIDTDVELCKVLLNEIGVALLPGSDFGMEPEELAVRVACVDYDGSHALAVHEENEMQFISKAMPNLIEGCDRLEKYLMKK